MVLDPAAVGLMAIGTLAPRVAQGLRQPFMLLA